MIHFLNICTNYVVVCMFAGCPEKDLGGHEQGSCLGNSSCLCIVCFTNQHSYYSA